MIRVTLRIFAIIVVALAGALSAVANFTVHGVTGSVQITHNGVTTNAVVGMEIATNDLIIIGDDSSIDVLESRNGRDQIYTSTSTGQMSVTRIVFDASKKASNNGKTVADATRMGKSNQSREGVVYVEKGKVTRALSSYDPEAEQVQVDVDQLARRVYAAIMAGTAGLDNQEATIVIKHQRTDSNGLRFMVENTRSFPIYFNVIKRSPGNNFVEISEVGQPVGSYALQPDQSIARGQNSGMDMDSSHLLIVTNYYFDVDELLTKLNGYILSNEPVTENQANFPLRLCRF